MLENMLVHHVEHGMALPPTLPARKFPRPSSPSQPPLVKQTSCPMAKDQRQIKSI